MFRKPKKVSKGIIFDQKSLSMTLSKAIALCWWVMRASEAEKQMVEVEVTMMMGDNQDDQVGNNEDAQEGRLLEKKIRVPLRNMRSVQRRRWKT